IELLVIAKVERADPFHAVVTAVVKRVCNGASFGPEVLVRAGNWNVGVDDGVNGADVVEALVSKVDLPNRGKVREQPGRYDPRRSAPSIFRAEPTRASTIPPAPSPA